MFAAGCPPIRLLHCEPDYDEKKHGRPLAMMRNSDSILDLLCAGIDRERRDG